MSKEEFLKIQTCVLKVHIHCEGCKGKVKKILQKIEGVYKINIDSEQGKVTVSGNVEPETLIKKLGKSGKHAELWGPPQKQNQNQQLNNQLKNLQLDNSGKGGNNKGQKGKNDNQQQPKSGGGPGGGGGGGGRQGQNPNQLQQMKALQDLKMAQFKDNPKMPFSKGAAKFNLPEEDDITDDEFDDDDDEFDDDEDGSEDDGMDDAPHLPPHKMKSMLGNGHVPNKMKAGQMQPQQVNISQAKGHNGNKINNNNNVGIAKKGVGNGGVPGQVNGGKKVGGGNGNNPNQGGSGGNNGGSPPSGGKSGNASNGGGAQNKNGKNGPAGNHGGGGGDNFSTNNNGIGGVKKGGGGMNDGVQGLPKASNVFPGMSGGNAGHLGTTSMMGQMGGNPVGPMGGNHMGQMGGNPMGQMGAVQGLPASAIQAGAGGYFNGVRPEGMTGNPFYQQQMAAGMMSQPPLNGNEGFHPMMYARPPPAVNYIPPYPYPYPYPYQPPADPYTSSFSDENPSSCSMM